MKEIIKNIVSGAKCFFYLQMVNLKSSMAVAADFWLDNICFAITQVTGLILIWVLFARIDSIAGWTLPEMAYLYGLQMLSMSLYRAVFQGVRDTPFLILRGMLDLLLTRPRNILLLLGSRRSNRTGIIDLVVGVALVVISSNMMDYEWNAARVAALILFVVCANILMVAIMLVQGAIAFWLINFDAFHEIVMALRDFARYPLNIYNVVIRAVLYTLVPVAFSSYVPAAVLLGKDAFSAVWGVGIVAVSVFSLLISIALFNLGLRNYASSGS